MANLSDYIEQHLKQLLAASPDGSIEIQRNDLAMKFNCVPSQINYVLATRFTLERGYLVESRRGGGGYVRIARVPMEESLELVLALDDLIGEAISQQAAEGILERLLNHALINAREARFLKTAMDRDVLLLPLPARDLVRARILKAVLREVLREEG